MKLLLLASCWASLVGLLVAFPEQGKWDFTLSTVSARFFSSCLFLGRRRLRLQVFFSVFAKGKKHCRISRLPLLSSGPAE